MNNLTVTQLLDIVKMHNANIKIVVPSLHEEYRLIRYLTTQNGRDPARFRNLECLQKIIEVAPTKSFCSENDTDRSDKYEKVKEYMAFERRYPHLFAKILSGEL